MAPDYQHLVASIYNAAWWIRHYTRGSRKSIQRSQAIQLLGLTVRDAFNKSEDFEPLLIALVDGLKKDSEPPF